MKGTVVALGVLAAGLCGGWAWSARRNATLEWQRLNLPFKEYSEKHDPNLKFGQIAPDFTLSDDTGRSYHLSEVCRSSQRTVVCGFRPTDPASIQQLIDFREADRDLKEKGLTILALTGASPNVVADLKHRYSLPFPVLFDPEERTM